MQPWFCVLIGLASNVILLEEIKKSEPVSNQNQVRISLAWWSIGESNPWPRQCECRALPTALIPRVLSWVFFHVFPLDPGAFFRHAVFDVKTDDCCGAYMGGLRPTNCANTPCKLRLNSIACRTEKCKRERKKEWSGKCWPGGDRILPAQIPARRIGMEAQMDREISFRFLFALVSGTAGMPMNG